MQEKLQELAQKYDVPEELLHKAISLEKEKLVLQNRRLAPRLVELIERYSASSSEEDSHGD